MLSALPRGLAHQCAHPPSALPTPAPTAELAWASAATPHSGGRGRLGPRCRPPLRRSGGGRAALPTPSRRSKSPRDGLPTPLPAPAGHVGCAATPLSVLFTQSPQHRSKTGLGLI